MKNLKYLKIDTVNPLYLILSKLNGYFELKKLIKIRI